MKIIADLQIHSKYSRAVSQQMVIPSIWDWAKRKSIDLVATGDWTHPLWMRELKVNLKELGNGFFAIKNNETRFETTENNPIFLLATEVSCIYSQGGRLRRIHILIWAPSFETADKINKELQNRGANLMSDGRPIMGLKSNEIAELVYSIDPSCLVIPAHAWTPWFSLYGSESGFDSIDECFGNFAKYIYAVETGLSSDPVMNWRIKELDFRSIISFSDAHSGAKLGREATVFDLEDISYKALRDAIVRSTKGNTDVKKGSKIVYTIEFYPEEGKYHYTGHRNCGIKETPSETREKGTTCPVCGKKLTVGVMHRVEQLAGREEKDLQVENIKIEGTKMEGICSRTFPERPPYVRLVPLLEILSEAIGGLPTSQKILGEYQRLTDNFGGEFKVLLNTEEEDIVKISGERVAEAINKVRTGDIVVDPGYDGVFGVVKIWEDKKKTDAGGGEKPKEQLSLF